MPISPRARYTSVRIPLRRPLALTQPTLGELMRLLAMAKKPDTDEGCWEWAGAKNPDGYGRFRWRGRLVMAHRVMYAAFNGGVCSEVHVHHRCSNPSCVNPSHLDTLSPSENVGECNTRRAAEKRAARESTTQENQHEDSPENPPAPF